MIEFEKGSIIAFSKIYPNTTITGYLFYMEENVYRKITDTREIFPMKQKPNLTQKLNALQC